MYFDIDLKLYFLFSPDLMTEKQRRMLYLQEMEGMAQIAKSMMEDISHVQTSFIQATHIQHAKPMFKVR